MAPSYRQLQNSGKLEEFDDALPSLQYDFLYMHQAQSFSHDFLARPAYCSADQLPCKHQQETCNSELDPIVVEKMEEIRHNGKGFTKLSLIPLNSKYCAAPDFINRLIVLSAKNNALRPPKSMLQIFTEKHKFIASCDFHIDAEGLVDEIDNNDVVKIRGCDDGCDEGEGVRGSEIGSEIVKGEKSKVTIVEGVGVEMEDGFADGEGGDCNDGFDRAMPTMIGSKLTGSMEG
ncbi:hypothetical protein JHK85_022073 [Glycine max]|nr:hypothetical protein JHK85_022073 [Glycine max]